MSILDNAIDSIVMGLEDYSSSNPIRLISCTRNLFAGILLLFKYKLVQMSPVGTNESLIKKRVVPKIDSSGEIIWVGKGRNTVNVHEIKEHFESLNINVNWKRVDKIQNFRNDIEHYHSEHSKDAMRSLISDSFIVIRDFLHHELSLDPQEYLGEYAWEILVSESEVYMKEKEECIQIIERIDWVSDGLYSAIVSFDCSACGSGLITIQNPELERYKNEFLCKSCGQIWEFEAFAEEAIVKHFSFDNYWSERQGDEPLTIACPECNYETYIIEERFCVICETSAIHNCKRCGMTIPVSEIEGSGYCGWCLHKMTKGE